jgi:6-hydroxycyclohex-1-ene-1-carbonyl-CoA dehydrogenase
MASMISWQMTEPGKPLAKVEAPIPQPGPGEVLVKVAGCGVCHTDLGFYYDGVRTKISAAR